MSVVFNPASDQRIDLANESDFEGMTVFSFSFWMRRDGNSSAGNSNGRILHKNGVFNCVVGDSSEPSNPDKVTFGLYHPTFAQIASSSSITNGVWYNIIGIYNGDTSSWVLYINNSQVASSASKSGATNTSIDPMRIGLDEDNSTQEFNGSLSEVYFWNGYELTSEDRYNLASSKVKGIGSQIALVNLKAYLPFDDFSDGAIVTGSNSLKDLSGSGNHGTPSNSPTSESEEVLSYSDFVKDVNFSTAVLKTRNYQLEFRKQGDTIWQKVPIS